VSGHGDSIRERRAREVPEREEGVVEEEEWPEEEDEWEDEWEDEEWEESLTEKLLNAIEAAMPELIGLAIDILAIMAVPTLVVLSMIVLFRTMAFEVYLAAVAATLITMFVSDAKTRLLQRLRLR
jgi:hypothetical protein